MTIQSILIAPLVLCFFLFFSFHFKFFSLSLALCVFFSSFALSLNEWVSSKKNSGEFTNRLLRNECIFFISNYESIIKVTNTIINHLSKVASKSDRDFSIFISSNYYVCLRLLLLLLHLLLYHAFHYFQLLLLSGVFFCIQLELDELILVLFVRLKDFCIWTPLYNSHSTFSFQILLFFIRRLAANVFVESRGQ